MELMHVIKDGYGCVGARLPNGWFAGVLHVIVVLVIFQARP